MTVLLALLCDCQGFFNIDRFILWYVWYAKLIRKYVFLEKSQSSTRNSNGLVEGLYFITDLNSDLYGFISLNQKIVLGGAYHVM